MGGAVAAAGSLLGGLAGNALMGKAAPLKVDTNIPGILSATVQKGTKKNDAINVAQVDPNGALSYFQRAAQENQNFVTQGLQLYTAGIQKALNEVNTSTRQANAMLSPLASRANVAANEYMKMLGLTPPSEIQSSDLMGQLKDIGANDIAGRIKAAEKIQDPAERQQAKQEILAQFSKQSSVLSQSDIDTATALAKATLGEAPQRQLTPLNNGYGKTNLARVREEDLIADQMRLDSDYQQKLQQYNVNLQHQINDNITAMRQDQVAKYNDLSSQFSDMYSNTAERGYTGSEIQSRLEQTPGYQFQFDQGQKAIERAAAATGNLASGNTLSALQQQGQGLASNYFQNYMANLNAIAQQGTGAIAQQSANVLNRGSANANLYTLGGQAAINAYSSIGQGWNAAFTNQGQAFMNASLYNAQAQNQAMESKRSRDAEMARQAVASGPGYMNAQTAQNAFNYGVFQNQQGGQAFYGGGGGGGNVPITNDEGVTRMTSSGPGGSISFNAGGTSGYLNL